MNYPVYQQQPPPQGYPQQAPQQGYPPQYPQVPQQAPQPYAQQPQQGYPQAYPGVPAPPPAQPTQPLAQGTIDDFYNQPSVGGGPSISWTNKDGTQKPLGTTYGGIVARDVTQADVQQETDFKTQQPKFYRDGRPKFVMKVPLKVQQSQEFPEGEAALYVKGQTRDELVRAMAEAGESGAPKGGAAIQVTLVHRKPMGQGMNPANIVQIQYTPAGGQPAQQPAAQPQQQYAPQGTEAPSPASVPQQVQQQPQYAQQPAPAPQPVQAPQQAQAPAQPQQAPQGMPEGFDQGQQELLQRLLAAQQQGQQG